MSKKIIKVLKGMPGHLENIENIVFGKSIIDFLLINFPPICNYQCKKCFTWVSSRKIENPLTLEELFSLIKQGKKWGAKVVGILGEGEPLFYNKAKEVIAYIDSLEMIPLISTNGSLLTKEITDFLFEHNTTVVVSLDTLDEKKYNEWCRGAANLSKLLKNLEYARKLYSQGIYKRSGSKIYQLAVHMTVTAENFKNIPDIINFCGEDIYFDCQPLAFVGDAEKNPSQRGDENTYEYYQKMSKILYPPMVLTKTEKGEDLCCLFYYGLAIGYEGEVMFDTHAIGSKYIGNIRKFSLEELLKKVKQARKIFIKEYATDYCPVRDKNYKKFLNFLENQSH